MEYSFSWKPEYLSSVIGVSSVTLGFITYWFLSINPSIRKAYFEKYKDNLEKAWVRYVVFQKLTGALFMGFIPGLICLWLLPYSISEYGVNFNSINDSLLYIGLIGAFMLIVNFRVSRNPFNLSAYPQMRLAEWSKKRILINAGSWAVYLFFYELMYRGLLLFTCYYSFGFWPALVINISFYMTTHIAKGFTETIGALPYGIALCFITISTGSILVAFVTHLILALSNDNYSIYHNPEMRFV
ncbi:MAG: CPBP family intramembrane metalloprotease [Flammeovirgaceae bacterium]|nr:CPBP family intramembrane metalloprotease [Flammeovirgaceae bacterium]